MKTALITVSGHVQGVFFRAHAKENAENLGLKGYAQNLPSGEVEILVQGDEPQIEEFIHWCAEGSPSAQVEDVEATWLEHEEKYDDFRTL